jgi:toxin ParE1/3/4
MKLRWTKEALAQLAEARKFIQRDNPRAARKVIDAIRTSAELLTSHSRVGRPGRIEGTRELVVRTTPYILVYAVLEDTVAILTLLHGSRNYP